MPQLVFCSSLYFIHISFLLSYQFRFLIFLLFFRLFYSPPVYFVLFSAPSPPPIPPHFINVISVPLPLPFPFSISSSSFSNSSIFFLVIRFLFPIIIIIIIYLCQACHNPYDLLHPSCPSPISFSASFFILVSVSPLTFLSSYSFPTVFFSFHFFSLF